MIDTAQDVHTLNIHTLLEEIGDLDDKIALLECQLEDERRENARLQRDIESISLPLYDPEDYCD